MKRRIIFCICYIIFFQPFDAKSAVFRSRCENIFRFYIPKKAPFKTDIAQQIRNAGLERSGNTYKKLNWSREVLNNFSTTNNLQQRFGSLNNSDRVYRGMHLTLYELDAILDGNLETSPRWKTIFLSTLPSEAILYLLPSVSDLPSLRSNALYISVLFEFEIDRNDRTRIVDDFSQVTGSGLISLPIFNVYGRE